ncbi:aminopeptidase P family protein [Corynebacterium sp. TA-R-1]|uniref:Aminopeptidase P family protein n=1 Tax=Corynebacterium stercoris TaxID=2943490 RepID=A0ABT1FZ51_9CORY|nr:M24 family metallopeptidase [Corynebacterium stercoris]MCP1387036.1 aminopeptidase P family protein [Corynebacterium stercoris]
MPFFSSEAYATRRQAVSEALAGTYSAGLIVGTGPEFTYLTGSAMGSHERLTALVFRPDGAVLAVAPLTDIDTLRAEAELAGVELAGWRDGESPYALVAEFLGADTAYTPVDIAPGLTADHIFALQGYLSKTRLVAPEIGACFTSKDAVEIAELTKAGAAIDRVHAQVPALLTPGRTEAEIAAEIADLILAEHARAEFIIVGSGPNGANPHHDYSDRVLEAGDIVVVDIGGPLESGYNSDCTRTYVAGGDPSQADPEALEAYAVLKRAQAAAVAAARPGITAGELDAVARDILAEAGYGEYFTHRLGHGIGLAVHEAPFIIGGRDVVLREGMAFSIEPGIYIPGRFGMRIEDIVVLTAEGAIALNTQPKDLR